MLKIPMSQAASALLRALIARAGVERDRILLTEMRSTAWQSLTFDGERHELELRIPGPDADMVVRRMTGGLSDAEFAIPGQIVADIVLFGESRRHDDGSIAITIEALTIDA